MKTTRGLDRLVFFTDAVTAIAITLLILPLLDDVSRAAQAEQGVGHFIVANLPQLATLALSFAVIARLWAAHHAIFEHVATYSGLLMLLSLVWAFTIVLLPLTTDMITAFESSSIVVGAYVGTMTASSLTLTGMSLLVHRHPQLELSTNPVQPRNIFGTVTTTISFAIALVVGVLVPSINFAALLVVFLTVPAQMIYDRRAPQRKASGALNPS